jgi:hypothetical protein
MNKDGHITQKIQHKIIQMETQMFEKHNDKVKQKL